MMATRWIRDPETCENRCVSDLPGSKSTCADFFAPKDRPLNVWAAEDLEDFLDEFVRTEGRGDYYNQRRCLECRVLAVQTHRCTDCFTEALFCTPCIVRLHADNPFHQIMVSTLSLGSDIVLMPV